MAKSLLSLLTLLPGALLCAAACGGSAFENNGLAGGGSSGAGAGSGSGSGGQPSGGTTGIAGSTGSAGSSSKAGSSGVAGSGAGGSGAGGSGGAIGSGGSGGLDMQACSSSIECEVVPVGCCSCGSGPVSNYTAINSVYDAQYGMRCGAVDCAACPPTVENPNDPTLYYVATCQAGRCAVVDLGASPVTACTSASDCMLRAGTGCCPSCGSGEPVAINKNQESELEQTVCGNQPVACAACAQTFSGYSVACTSGRCSVVLTPCTPDQPCPL